MGKIMSLMARPAKTFNIESRAHKIISREKPVPAPQYETTKRQIEIARTANPNFMETHNKKDSELDERLKNIYVKSHDPQLQSTEIEQDPNRPLPTLTYTHQGFEYGFWEPEETSLGTCSLKQAMTFIADYNSNPIKNSVTEIAAKYKLDPKHVKNILEYYRVFKVTIVPGQEHFAHVEHKKIESKPKQED